MECVGDVAAVVVSRRCGEGVVAVVVVWQGDKGCCSTPQDDDCGGCGGGMSWQLVVVMMTGSEGCGRVAR